MTRYFSEDHEWLAVEDDQAQVGITDHASEQLGELVYVELPDVGARFNKGDECAVVESVKASSEIYAPVDGEIIAVNEKLADDPALVSREPQAGGWLFKMRLQNAAQLSELLDENAYKKHLD